MNFHPNLEENKRLAIILKNSFKPTLEIEGISCEKFKEILNNYLEENCKTCYSLIKLE